MSEKDFQKIMVHVLWISPHNCHEKRPRREPDITRRKCCEKLAATRHIRSLFWKNEKIGRLFSR
jgi:hypothetical protein